MDENKYNRKILVILKILLFVVGFTLGFLAIYQILDVYEDLVKNWGLRIMYYTASSLVPALALTLSAKGFYKLLESVSQKIAKGANLVRLQDLVIVLLSVVLGTLFGYACDLILSFFLNILALRLVFDILVGMLGIYIVLLLSFKSVRSSEEVEDKKNEPIDLKTSEQKGYLLLVSAFKNKQTLTLFSKLLIGQKYVLGSLEGSSELLEDSTALYNFESLRTGGYVSVLKESIKESETEALLRLLLKYCLKPVVSSREDATLLLGEMADSALIIEEL